MPVMPLMPDSSDQVQTPMPGGGGMMPPTGPGPGGNLASLFGGGALPQAGIDPLQGALGQFDMLAQGIADLARVFPTSGQMASQMMEILDLWRQEVLVMVTPQASSMPGADMMM